MSGLASKPAKRIQVAYKGSIIGDLAFGHLVIDGKVMVFPVALRDIQAVRLDNLKDWMRTCKIQLGIIANFEALRLQTVFVRA